MNFTDNYIKMASAATRVQELRGPDLWELGDYYTDDVLLRPQTIASRGGLKVHIVTEGEAYPPEMYKPVWLPLQHQLQGMVKFPTIRVMLNNIRTFSYDIRGRDYTTLEELWLAYVMHEKYSKLWSPEREEWIDEE